MHRVQTTVRHILPADLPVFTPIEGGVSRPCTAQELAGLGIVSLGGDYYSCIHQDQHDGMNWISPAMPGVDITNGVKRYRDLPIDIKLQVMRAQISRPVSLAMRTALTLAVQMIPLALRNPIPVALILNVPVAGVQLGDVVQETDLIPHGWAGEPK